MDNKTYMQNRLLLKIDTLIKVCKNIQSLSYDNKYKVGCIIVDKDLNKINSIGYNGNYKGGPNERDSMESGQSGFIHAELNALLKLKVVNPDNQILICTWTPCSHCAKCIVNAGITKCIFINDYIKDRQFEEIFSIAKVEYVTINEKLADCELALTKLLNA